MKFEFEDKVCPRCGCCGSEFEQCPHCIGTGADYHNCGDEPECAMYPRSCEACGGEGGWTICLGNCDEKGNHRHNPR